MAIILWFSCPLNWSNPWSQLPVWLKKLFCVIKGYFISFLLSNIIGYLRFCGLDFFPLTSSILLPFHALFHSLFLTCPFKRDGLKHDGLEYLIFRESFGGSLHFLKADSYGNLPYGHSVFSIAQFGFSGSAGICFRGLSVFKNPEDLPLHRWLLFVSI